MKNIYLDLKITQKDNFVNMKLIDDVRILKLLSYEKYDRLPYNKI